MKINTGILPLVVSFFFSCSPHQPIIDDNNSNDTIKVIDPVVVLPPLEDITHISSYGLCNSVFSFLDGTSMYLHYDDVYVIKGIAMDVSGYGRTIKFVEDLKGNFPENINTLMVWGDGFGVIESARFDNLARDFSDQDVLIMILTTYDNRFAELWKDLKHNEVLGIPFIENPGDFRTIGCVHSVLKLSKDTVYGYIAGSYMTNCQTMLWKDLDKVLKEILSLKI